MLIATLITDTVVDFRSAYSEIVHAATPDVDVHHTRRTLDGTRKGVGAIGGIGVIDMIFVRTRNCAPAHGDGIACGELRRYRRGFAKLGRALYGSGVVAVIP